MDWNQPQPPAAPGRTSPSKPGPPVRDRIVEFARIDPHLIDKHPDNYRTHDDQQRQALRGVLERVGLAGACVVYQRDGRYRLIDGELRTEELQQPVPCVVVDVDDDEAGLLLASMDPLALMAGTNRQRLQRLLETDAVQAAAGDNGLGELLRRQRLAASLPAADERSSELAADASQSPEWTEADEEETLSATEQLRRAMREKWQTEVGQVWSVGPQRIFIGDAVNHLPALIDVMQAIGGQATMAWTDPPYGVSYSARDNEKIAGDRCGTNIVGLFHAVLPAVLQQGCPWYVCGSAPNVPLVFQLADHAMRTVPKLIVWNKMRMVIQRHHYHSAFELIFYGWARHGSGRKQAPAKQRWFGDRRQVDLWSVPSVTAKERRHINQKPVELIRRAINNSSPPGATVVDPFLGSGSMLVAAHETGRTGVGAELDPGNAAIAIEWLADVTGEAPEMRRVELPAPRALSAEE